jgi:hypothetical protein
VPELPASVLDLLETDDELDGDLVLELERAEETRVRGDADTGAARCSWGPVVKCKRSART